jgi:Xaa-Pro aminopeptidase
MTLSPTNLENVASVGTILDDVQRQLREDRLDALVLTASWSVAYVLGFRYLSVDRLVWGVVPAHGRPVLVVPEYEQAAALASSGELVDVRPWADGVDPLTVLTDVFGPVPPAARIGIDKQATTVADADRIRSLLPGAVIVDEGPVLAGMREVKRPDELDRISYAATVLDRTIARFVREELRPGRSEAELSAELTRLLRIEGADWTAFPPNLTSGPRSAFPHGPDMSARRGAAIGADLVLENELIVLDVSAICGGYCADISRTYVLAEAPEQITWTFDVVREAHLAAIDACRPGATGHDVDRAARSIIEAHGLGELFPQRTGHGLGLQIHESPDITVGSRDELRPGMVASIEPAVYMPGVGGIRNEDMVLIGTGAPTVLTHVPSDLVLRSSR